MGQLVANVKKTPVTQLDDTPMKTSCVPEQTDSLRMRVAGIADTPDLLAEAVYQYATLVEKRVLMGHLIRTGDLCPPVRNLLLDIATRADRKYLLLKRLNAEQLAQTTGRLETIENGVLEVAFAHAVNTQPELANESVPRRGA